MAKNLNNARIQALLDMVNEDIKEESQKSPKEMTFDCTSCEKEYLAKNLSDMYVCPLCGALQED